MKDRHEIIEELIQSGVYYIAYLPNVYKITYRNWMIKISNKQHLIRECNTIINIGNNKTYIYDIIENTYNVSYAIDEIGMIELNISKFCSKELMNIKNINEKLFIDLIIIEWNKKHISVDKLLEYEREFKGCNN